MKDDRYQTLLNAVEYEMRRFYMQADAAGKYAEQYHKVGAPQTAAWKEGQAHSLEACATTLERIINNVER